MNNMLVLIFLLVNFLVVDVNGVVLCAQQKSCIDAATCGVGGNCTSTGGAAPPNAGTCNCASCVTKQGAVCTADSGCANIVKGCEINGKCVCPVCTLNKLCSTDGDCGGYAGTCGYLAAKSLLWEQCGGGKGPAGQACTCKFCPNKACYSHASACTVANGAAMCGDKNFCIAAISGLPCNGTAGCACRCNIDGVLNAHNTGRSCNSKAGNGLAICGADALCLSKPAGGTACAIPADVCQCKPTNIVSGSAILQTGAGVPVCVQGAGCGGTATEFQCGFQDACRSVLPGAAKCNVTASAAGVDAVCKCDCAKAPVINMPVPNSCLAATTSNLGVALTCDYSDSSCGYMPPGGVFPKMGALQVKVCKPNVIMKGVCSCGYAIYPKYTVNLLKTCAKNADCQTATDKTALCNKLTGLCVLANVAGLALANTATSKCKVHADCGWGMCYESDYTSPCKTGSMNCECAPAGCVTASQCPLNDLSAACGLHGNCKGFCYCH